MGRRTFAAALLATGLLGATVFVGCAGPSDNTAEPGSSQTVLGDAVGPETKASDASGQVFPDVLDTKLTRDGDGFRIAVTISSPYDTPDRYADGWRVMTPDGEVLVEHDLAHDHADELPFTRDRGPFAIPDGVAKVVVEGRDQANGYGGETVALVVPE